VIKQTETASSFIRYSQELNRMTRLTPTARIMADYFLYQNYLIMEGIKMMEIILNREVLNSMNVQIRSQNSIKIFIVKSLNDYLCLQYQEKEDIMISCIGTMYFSGLNKNG